MKKVIAVMLTLVMAFAFCVPSFAEGEDAGSGFDFNAIIEQIQQIIGSIGRDAVLSCLISAALSAVLSAAKAKHLLFPILICPM